MKLKNPMLVVTDIDKSVAFYKKVFGLRVVTDFGANKIRQSRRVRTRRRGRNSGSFRLVALARRQPCGVRRTKNCTKFRTFAVAEF
ncbi:MAG: VOC family protein [Candidatus Fimenecus sp.]